MAKSPYKRRQIYERKTRHQQQKQQNLTGRAVGAIGDTLGKAFDEFKDAKDKTVAEHKAVDDKVEEILQEGNEEIYGEPTFDDPPLTIPPVEDEYDDDDLDALILPKGGSGGNDTTEAINNFMPTIEGVLGTNQNTSHTPIMGNNGNPYPELKPFYGPDQPTAQQGAIGAARQAARKAGQPDPYGNSGGFDLGPLGKAIGGWWEQNSPFNRTEYDPNAANSPIGEGYRQRAKPLSYLGDIGVAAAEGYNVAVDRHNYKRAVWETKQRELDQQFGELVVPPSGSAPFDASVETMAREWKSELADLAKNKGSMDPAEFASRKHEIMGRSRTYKAASEQIQQLLTDYANDKDMISASTKPETLDLIETLSQGGPVQIGNHPETGQPTLMGETLNGQPISVPLAQIANGKNAFRYNKKVDISKPLNDINKGLANLKRSVEQANGSILRGPQAWAAVENSAAAQIDTLLSNEATVRAIAADTFNIDYDEYERRGSTAAKDDVKELLMQRLEQMYAPAEQAQILQRSAPKVPAGQQTNQRIQNFIQQNPITNPKGLEQVNNFLAKSGKRVVQHPEAGWIIVKGNKAIGRVDPNNPTALYAHLGGKI